MKEELNVIHHECSWWWGTSVDIVKDDGTAIVCVKFDKKSFPTTAYICDLSVVESERRKGIGWVMMQYALAVARNNGMKFARLHVDKKKGWLIDWYKRLGFDILLQDDNEYEMVRRL